MAQMCFFDLSDRYAKKDSLVEVNAVVQWEGSGQHWSGSGSIFRDALKLMKRWGVPRVLVTDKLRSYGVAVRDLCPSVDHRSHKGLNNRSEASHRGGRVISDHLLRWIA